MNERGIREFLEEHCYTDPETQDPTRPLIADGDSVSLNPDFDPSIDGKAWVKTELERRDRELGTSFVLYPDPLCNLHRGEGELGDQDRREILYKLEQRFVSLFAAQFADDPPPLDELRGSIEMGLSPERQPGLNNGEVYVWMRGIALKKGFIFTMLGALTDSLEKEPLMIRANGREWPMVFYGAGYRYI